MAPFLLFVRDVRGRLAAAAEVALAGFVGDVEQAVVVAFDGDGEAHGLLAEFDHVPDIGAAGGFGLVGEVEAGTDELGGLLGLPLEGGKEAGRGFNTGPGGLAALKMEHVARDGGRGIAGEAAEAAGPASARAAWYGRRAARRSRSCASARGSGWAWGTVRGEGAPGRLRVDDIETAFLLAVLRAASRGCRGECSPPNACGVS